MHVSGGQGVPPQERNETAASLAEAHSIAEDKVMAAIVFAEAKAAKAEARGDLFHGYGPMYPDPDEKIDWRWRPVRFNGTEDVKPKNQGYAVRLPPRMWLPVSVGKGLSSACSRLYRLFAVPILRRNSRPLSFYAPFLRLHRYVHAYRLVPGIRVHPVSPSLRHKPDRARNSDRARSEPKNMAAGSDKALWCTRHGRRPRCWVHSRRSLRKVRERDGRRSVLKARCQMAYVRSPAHRPRKRPDSPDGNSRKAESSLAEEPGDAAISVHFAPFGIFALASPGLGGL